MPVMQSPPGAETVIDGQRYLYFVGTGYLGLHGHPDVVSAACEATRKYGLGTATSRSGFGNAPPTLEVERASAEFFGSEDAFYFASGYTGNQLLAASLKTDADALFLDACAHYSVVEATRFGGLPVWQFPHADPGGLRDSLRRNLPPGKRPIVMSDGVFAALGTIAPVVEYRDVLREYPGAAICLDDCHGFGVLGDRGRGTLEYVGLHDDGVNTDWTDVVAAAESPRLYVTATLSKAFGGYGGIICGSRAFVQRVKASSHIYDGASAPPIPVAAASARALRLVTNDRSIVRRVQQNALLLRGKLKALGLNTIETPVPIINLVIGNAANMERIQRTLMREGILIAYRSSYAGLGSAGALRLAVFATHSAEMIDILVDALARAV